MTRLRQTFGALVLVTAAVTLAACTSFAPSASLGPVAVEPAVITVDQPPAVSLPPGAHSVRTVAVSTPPRAVGDVFISAVFPDATHDDLRIVAFDDSSTRWTLATNPSCSGWADSVTAAGVRVVVVLDSDARVDDGVIAQTTVASGFRADSGGQLWSGRGVIGPVRGTGVIFTGAVGSVLSNATAATQTLRGDDGGAVEHPHEAELAPVFEHAGVVVLSGGSDFVGFDSQTNRELWRQGSAGTLDTARSHGHVFATLPEGELRHVFTGAVLAQGAVTSAAVSADASLTALTMTMDGATHVMLVDGEGIRWRQPVDAGSRVTAVATEQLFIDTGRQRRILATLDGSLLAEGSFAAPVALTTQGVAVVATDDPQLYEVIRFDNDG
ncbi:hypothetical protein [Microbacterium sp. YY-01]|uniref:hypothetical protein n=1 Tax=Microbacterium sp. YY-01 TaxID=3421634 RepID=UPI003D169CB4